MSFTQILAWLAGPGASIVVSWLGEQFLPWVNWKPQPALGLDPKAILAAIITSLLGLVAYLAATSIPATTISTLDPYVSAAFPFLAFAAGQLWHALVNKRLAGPTTTAPPVGG